jgi:hypothetical protein
MALESTQPLTEMSTRNLPGGKGRPAHKADKLTAVYESTVKKMWEPQNVTTLWASTACYREIFFLTRFQWTLFFLACSPTYEQSKNYIIDTTVLESFGLRWRW